MRRKNFVLWILVLAESNGQEIQPLQPKYPTSVEAVSTLKSRVN